MHIFFWNFCKTLALFSHHNSSKLDIMLLIHTNIDTVLLWKPIIPVSNSAGLVQVINDSILRAEEIHQSWQFILISPKKMIIPKRKTSKKKKRCSTYLTSSLNWPLSDYSYVLAAVLTASQIALYVWSMTSLCPTAVLLLKSFARLC